MRATLSNPVSSWRPRGNGDCLALSPFPIVKAAAGNINSTNIAGIRSQGSSAQNAAETSGTRKPQTSVAQASPRPKIESILGIQISLTRSGRNAALIGYRICITMRGFSISEAGKNTVDSNTRRRTALIVRSTALLLGKGSPMKKRSQKRRFPNEQIRALERSFSRINGLVASVRRGHFRFAALLLATLLP